MGGIAHAATSGADAPVLHTYDVSRSGPAPADDA